MPRAALPAFEKQHLGVPPPLYLPLAYSSHSAPEDSSGSKDTADSRGLCTRSPCRCTPSTFPCCPQRYVWSLPVTSYSDFMPQSKAACPCRIAHHSINPHILQSTSASPVSGLSKATKDLQMEYVLSPLHRGMDAGCWLLPQPWPCPDKATPAWCKGRRSPEVWFLDRTGTFTSDSFLH